MPSARELARLTGVCKAPVIQHFTESISGSTTIRGFDQESRFKESFMKLIDGYSQPKFYSASAMEWLCFRLDMFSSITFAFSLVFLVSVPTGAIDPREEVDDGLEQTVCLNQKVDGINQKALLLCSINRWLCSGCLALDRL